MKLNSQLMSLLANRLDLRMTEGEGGGREGERVMEGEGRKCGMCTALLSGESNIGCKAALFVQYLEFARAAGAEEAEKGESGGAQI